MQLHNALVNRLRKFFFCLVLLSCAKGSGAQQTSSRIVQVAGGWANNSVNTVIFRKNSLVTHGNTQYTAFYDNDQYVVIGRRVLPGGKWQLKKTAYRGDATDAHKCISIITDGAGYLHLAWDHHNNPLHYCRSVQPGSLELTKQMPMTGNHEQRVTYPEFYTLPDGDLLFLYRDGQSGQGNLVINHYHTATKQWTQLHSNLIDGESTRSAYWQACVDNKGTIHLSWVWRETPDVASNHDMCYACSRDGGRTWQKSNDDTYTLPITAATAEYAYHIPQRSELINQTSMYADPSGNPYIATYWRDTASSIPQYHLIYKDRGQWTASNTGFRTTAFSLSGSGTKRIPVSRPQIIAWPAGRHTAAAIIFRDEERGNKVSAALNDDISTNKWLVKDLDSMTVGSWEPSYDTELWKSKQLLHIFIQRTEQLDSEGKANIPPQPVSILECNPKTFQKK